MDKTSTQNDTIRFVFGEMEAKETRDFALLAFKNEDLINEVNALNEVRDAMENSNLSAPKSVLDRVKNFARIYEPIEMPDESHTDLILN